MWSNLAEEGWPEIEQSHEEEKDSHLYINPVSCNLAVSSCQFHEEDLFGRDRSAENYVGMHRTHITIFSHD